MDFDREELYKRELAEAAEYINDYLQEIPLYRPGHDWLVRNGFEDTSYQNDIFKVLDSDKKNMRQIKEELADMDKQNTKECDPQVPNEAAKEAEKRIAIAVLEEFNKWRRGQGEYAWNEDPSKNKVLDITPEQIGFAIDYAVEFLKTH